MKKLIIGTVAVLALAGCQASSDGNSDAVGHHKTKAKPSYTKGQQEAVGSAKDYLSSEAFSRAGLVDQLDSKDGEGFSKADALFAVNHISVNWKIQAAKSAKEYLSEQHFSRDGLIEQLESKDGEGFTHAQAVYGVNKAGL